MGAKPRAARTKAVGVGQLRQNLSKFLAQVKQGQRFEVTEHGHPVARLVPLDHMDAYHQRLAAAGLSFIAATRPASFAPPPPPPAGVRPASAFLEDERRQDYPAEASDGAARRRL